MLSGCKRRFNDRQYLNMSEAEGWFLTGFWQELRHFNMEEADLNWCKSSHRRLGFYPRRRLMPLCCTEQIDGFMSILFPMLLVKSWSIEGAHNLPAIGSSLDIMNEDCVTYSYLKLYFDPFFHFALLETLISLWNEVSKSCETFGFYEFARQGEYIVLISLK
jgi:hypothetical protein